jgi:hypothetical protein
MHSLVIPRFSETKVSKTTLAWKIVSNGNKMWSGSVSSFIVIKVIIIPEKLWQLKSSLVFTGLEEENRLIAHTQAQKAAYPDRKAGPETRPALTWDLIIEQEFTFLKAFARRTTSEKFSTVIKVLRPLRQLQPKGNLNLSLTKCCRNLAIFPNGINIACTIWS